MGVAVGVAVGVVVEEADAEIPLSGLICLENVPKWRVG